jgi:hypothetical protein
MTCAECNEAKNQKPSIRRQQMDFKSASSAAGVCSVGANTAWFRCGLPLLSGFLLFAFSSAKSQQEKSPPCFTRSALFFKKCPFLQDVPPCFPRRVSTQPSNQHLITLHRPPLLLIIVAHHSTAYYSLLP